MRARSQLFLVDGTSSLWKEELVDYVDHMHGLTLVKKVTTRGPRGSEDMSRTDLRHVNEDAFSSLRSPYSYKYAGERYAVSPESLKAALDDPEAKAVFLIVRDTRLIRRLKEDFHDYSPVSAFIYADVTTLPEVLPAPGRELRVSSAHQAYQDYLRDPGCYDEVLLRPGDANGFYRLVDLLLLRGEIRRHAILGLSGSEKVVVASTRAVRNATRAILGGTGLLAILVGIAAGLLTGDDEFTAQDLALLALCLTLLLISVLVSGVLLSEDRWRPLD